MKLDAQEAGQKEQLRELEAMKEVCFLGVVMFTGLLGLLLYMALQGAAAGTLAWFALVTEETQADPETALHHSFYLAALLLSVVI